MRMNMLNFFPPDDVQKIIDDEEIFLSMNKHIEDVFLRAKRAMGDSFFNTLLEIYKEYSKYQSAYVSNAKSILEEIDTKWYANPLFHSAKARSKSPTSLITKIIKKCAQLQTSPPSVGNYDIEKYRKINKDNYGSIVTDIIGIRFVVRYRAELKIVHDLLLEKLPFSNDNIVSYQDGSHDKLKDLYLIEKPKAFCKHPDEKDEFEAQYRNLNVIESREGYSSIHYVISYKQFFSEIQLRTIFDETWGEAQHDLAYKSREGIDDKESEYIKILSKIMSAQLTVAEKQSELMYSICKKHINNKRRT